MIKASKDGHEVHGVIVPSQREVLRAPSASASTPGASPDRAQGSRRVRGQLRHGGGCLGLHHLDDDLDSVVVKGLIAGFNNSRRHRF